MGRMRGTAPLRSDVLPWQKCLEGGGRKFQEQEEKNAQGIHTQHRGELPFLQSNWLYV